MLCRTDGPFGMVMRLFEMLERASHYGRTMSLHWSYWWNLPRHSQDMGQPDHMTKVFFRGWISHILSSAPSTLRKITGTVYIFSWSSDIAYWTTAIIPKRMDVAPRWFMEGSVKWRPRTAILWRQGQNAQCTCWCECLGLPYLRSWNIEISSKNARIISGIYDGFLSTRPRSISSRHGIDTQNNRRILKIAVRYISKVCIGQEANSPT